MQTHTMSGLETGAVGHGTQHLTKATSFAWCEHILNQVTIRYKSKPNALNGLGRATSLKSCQELGFVILIELP
jgi:hypothetical protein